MPAAVPVDPSSSTGGPTLLQFFGQAVVVVLGWVVVHKLSLSRDRERSRREMLSRSVDAINEQLNELLEMAHGYHTTPRDIGREQRIVMTIQDIALNVIGLQVLKDPAGNISLCQTAIRRVREAITGQHFADEHIGPIVEGDAILERAAGEVLHAKRCLVNFKHQQFANK